MTRSLTREDLRAIGDLQAKISKFFYTEGGAPRYDRDEDFYLEVTIKVMDGIDGMEVGRFVDEDGWIGFQAAARPVAAPQAPELLPTATWTCYDPFPSQTGAQG